ncbi:MAG: hypothetical protein ACK4RV_02215 [Caulobacter sp.]
MAGSVADEAAAAGQRSFSAAHARQNAQLVGNQGAARELQQRRMAGQLLGAQAAAIAESGTGFGGSNRLIQEQDAFLAEADALAVRYDTRLKISAYDNEARVLKPTTSPLQKLLGRRGLGQLNHNTWKPGSDFVVKRAW